MPLRTKRATAWAVDAILALMLTGLVMTPLVSLADPHVWTQITPAPLIWALCLTLIPLLTGGASPGKRWLKLRLTGTGCLICRELRRSGWALILGAALLAPQALPYGVADALRGIAIGLAIWGGLFPIALRRPDFPHNTATDFQVSHT